MLPLSRPLFDQNAARLMTLSVAAIAVRGTLVVLARHWPSDRVSDRTGSVGGQCMTRFPDANR